jgi:hypothetical protein
MTTCGMGWMGDEADEIEPVDVAVVAPRRE